MAFLDYLRQQQQQEPAPLLNLQPMAQGLLQGYLQGDQMRRQREHDEHTRKQWQQAEEDRKRARQIETLKADTGLAQNMAETGNYGDAGRMWNDRIAPARGQLGYAQGPALQGGRRQLSNPELMGMDEAAIRKSFTLGDQGQVGFTAQDFNNDQSRAAIRGLLDVQRPKPIELSPGNTLLDPESRRPIYTAPGRPQPPRTVKLANGNLGVIGTDGTISDTGTPFYQPPVAAWSPVAGGQGAVNRYTGEAQSTGFMPQETPAEKARGARQAQGRGAGDAYGYAAYLTDRYGVQFGKDSIYRPAGTIPGETGVHSTRQALDVPLNPESQLGRTIIADAQAAGYFVYTSPHGTGPHIHIETNRNPDGSMKTGRGGSGGGGGGAPKKTQAWLNNYNSALQRLKDEREATARSARQDPEMVSTSLPSDSQLEQRAQAVANRTTGAPKSKPASAAATQAETNRVLTSVSNLRASIAKRHTRANINGKAVTDWDAVDRDWRPKAVKILTQKGIDPNLYLPGSQSEESGEPNGASPAGFPLAPDRLIRRQQPSSPAQQPSARPSALPSAKALVQQVLKRGGATITIED